MTDEEREAMDAIMARLNCPMEIRITPKIETSEFKDFTEVYKKHNAEIDEILSSLEHLQPGKLEIVEYSDSIVVSIIFAKDAEQEE